MDVTNTREDQLDGRERPGGDDEEITAMVRTWPPLTESQRERLALLLLGGR
ncbi:hypothetical protein GCM10010149_06640 [Nonomuraea roseoviolacea subsp. roseoviolacea]|uniref:hypothetical protein n=1 Tax=Nonomuraea roseoviolacea TaxID=103837 RepID=UPI0031DA4987